MLQDPELASNFKEVRSPGRALEEPFAGSCAAETLLAARASSNMRRACACTIQDSMALVMALQSGLSLLPDCGGKPRDATMPAISMPVPSHLGQGDRLRLLVAPVPTRGRTSCQGGFCMFVQRLKLDGETTGPLLRPHISRGLLCMLIHIARRRCLLETDALGGQNRCSRSNWRSW